MSGRWWRAYNRARNDPKVQRLPGETFKAWFNLVCLASENGGHLPSLADCAFELRKSEDATGKILDSLKSAGLFDDTGNGLSPHNWDGLQYKSDVSNERVKRHRKRQRNVTSSVTVAVTGNGTVTPSESEADTETDSVAKATGSDAAPDLLKAAFDAGIKVLGRAGHSEQQARGLIGKWRKEYGEGAVLEALGKCQLSGVTEPVSYITAALKATARAATGLPGKPVLKFN